MRSHADERITTGSGVLGRSLVDYGPVGPEARVH